MQKQGIWIVWAGLVVAMLFGSGWIATVGRWGFGLMFVVHVVEFVVNRSLFEKVGGSMGHHFVQTLIYGFMHWAPLKEQLAGQEAGSPGDA